MGQIQLADNLFKEAQRRASEAGYSSVDDYVADVLGHDLVEDIAHDTPNLDQLFTPERLAHIDAAAADIEAGHSYTNEQANAELAKRRAEWLLKNPR